MNNKYFKCPFCSKKYINKNSLYEHMDNIHNEQLNGLTPAHFYFNYRNHKTEGKCIICKGPTKFNEETERYDRLCSEKCKEKYIKMFKERMIKKYGKDNLLNDPEMQKKMLASRKISGTYIWTDKTKYTYTGSYEKDMLQYLDKILNFESKDVISPAPQIFKYEYEGKEHFYMPDIYITSLNLIIEVKGTNNHYQKRDINIQKIKKETVEKEKKYNYIIVFDKKYDELLKLIEKIKNKNN